MTREEAIRETICRLVAFYQPDRIYLFGSAARDHAGPESDLDFLVVVPDDTPREMLKKPVYSALQGINLPVDVVPWRRTDFDGRAVHVNASLPATVVREGKLVYVAGRVPA